MKNGAGRDACVPRRVAFPLVGCLLLTAVTAAAQTPPQTKPQQPGQTTPQQQPPTSAPAAPAPVSPTPAAQTPPAASTTAPANMPVGVTPPADYVIGADDQLSIVFWRDKDMTSDVQVRPDGKISLPLLNDIQAAGLTPDQLRAAIVAAAAKYIQDPTVTVVVKQIVSRRVFVTGQVTKPGAYALSGPMTVLQMLASAGGVLEYADTKKILIMRTENGKTTNFPFNYKDVMKGRNLKQNILLKPGDTIIVP